MLRRELSFWITVLFAFAVAFVMRLVQASE